MYRFFPMSTRWSMSGHRYISVKIRNDSIIYRFYWLLLAFIKYILNAYLNNDIHIESLLNPYLNHDFLIKSLLNPYLNNAFLITCLLNPNLNNDFHTTTSMKSALRRREQTKTVMRGKVKPHASTKPVTTATVDLNACCRRRRHNTCRCTLRRHRLLTRVFCEAELEFPIKLLCAKRAPSPQRPFLISRSWLQSKNPA